MMSTIQPALPSDPMFGNPFASFEAGFTPWDYPECFPSDDVFFQSHNPKPVAAGSDALGSPEPEPVISDEPNQNSANSNSGSTEPIPNRDAPLVDERKRRRMISNRESARRSRMRKQKHVENLRNQVNRFRMENRDLSNRLRFVLYHCHRVQTENHQLRSEYDMLRHKLSDVRQILVFRQLQQFTTAAWPCNSTVTSEQTPSLIT